MYVQLYPGPSVHVCLCLLKGMMNPSISSQTAPKLTQSQHSYQSTGLVSADGLDMNNFLMVFMNEFNMSHICIKTRDMLDHLSLALNALENKPDQIQ